MEIMSEQLDKEEAGLTTDRGLEGCVPGLQAFELFITSTFRKKYDKVSHSIPNPNAIWSPLHWSSRHVFFGKLSLLFAATSLRRPELDHDCAEAGCAVRRILTPCGEVFGKAPTRVQKLPSHRVSASRKAGVRSRDVCTNGGSPDSTAVLALRVHVDRRSCVSLSM